MTFTIEDVKRLVPEATHVTNKNHGNMGVLFLLDDQWFQSTHGPGLLLLTTRRQLEIAMEGLDELARLGNAPNLGNSHGNIRAQQALESIKKVGES